MTAQNAKTKKIFDGRYEVLSIVGRGAKSVVYRAKLTTAPFSEVALKVLIDHKGKTTSSERLRREALAMVSCRHRYVARLDDFHSLGSLCYLAMEYAPESDLRAYTKSTNGRLPIELAERFFKQAAEGLSFIHRAGIIHRDLKPENILVINEKEIRITDFGVALLPGEECSISELQSGIGTMNYMAPEIIEGQTTDNRADIYALGVVFYEMLSGSNPFQGAPLAKQIDFRKNERFPKLHDLDPKIPKYLSELIHQCMRYSLDQRFSSCDQLLTNIINKKSEDFSKRQATARNKPARPRTNNIHKKRKKNSLSATNTEGSESLSQSDTDLFEEFNKIINSQSENNSSLSGQTHSAEDIEQALSTTDLSHSNPSIEQQDPRKDSNIALENPELYDDSEFEESGTPTESFKSFQQQQSNSTGMLPVVLKGLFFLLLIFAVIRVGISLVSFGFSKLSSGSDVIELPTFAANQISELSFPNLPSGVYSGSINGLFSETSTALTLISFQEQGKLAILLGIQGWQPKIVDLSDLKNSQTLVVKSNGLILELKGEVKSGKIVGIYSGLANGAQGRWSLEPAL
jgi:serine/threonine protein kinase